MLAPKRAKYKKQFRGTMKGMAQTGSKVNFGNFGLKALTGGWITSRQIEAARRSLTHYTQKGGRIWIRIFPDKPITKKPAETRMGSGKGDVADYVAVIRPGRILFEIAGVEKSLVAKAMKMAGAKLALQTEMCEK